MLVWRHVPGVGPCVCACVCVYHLTAERSTGGATGWQNKCAAVSVAALLMWWRNRVPQRWSKCTWSSNCTNKGLNAVTGFSHMLKSPIHPDVLRVVNVTLKAGHSWNCFAVSRYSGTSLWDYKFLLHLTFPFQSHICLHATTRAYTLQMP